MISVDRKSNTIYQIVNFLHKSSGYRGSWPKIVFVHFDYSPISLLFKIRSYSFHFTFTTRREEVDSVRSRVATGYQPKSLKASAQYVQD